jgi:hypothetical protein
VAGNPSLPFTASLARPAGAAGHIHFVLPLTAPGDAGLAQAGSLVHVHSPDALGGLPGGLLGDATGLGGHGGHVAGDASGSADQLHMAAMPGDAAAMHGTMANMLAMVDHAMPVCH